MDSRNDRYMLLTFEEHPNNIKAGKFSTASGIGLYEYGTLILLSYEYGMLIRIFQDGKRTWQRL